MHLHTCIHTDLYCHIWAWYIGHDGSACLWNSHQNNLIHIKPGQCVLLSYFASRIILCGPSYLRVGHGKSDQPRSFLTLVHSCALLFCTQIFGMLKSNQAVLHVDRWKLNELNPITQNEAAVEWSVRLQFCSRYLCIGNLNWKVL